MKTIRLGEATRNVPHRQAFVLAVAAAVALLCGALSANATTFYSAYGQSRAWNVTLPASGTHTFEVDGIASYKYTEWYVNTGAGYVYKETDNSGLFAIDPDYSWTFSSGTTAIKAIVYNSDWSVKESHIWNVSVQTIISAYWLTPVYVTEGTVVTMRALVTGFSIGDQFSFDIYEDDYPFGSTYVTTKYGTVYSSGGNLYVGATWTSVWQSDQSGDPEFYLIASRGSISQESSRADANEMHVARGSVLSRSPSGLSQTITQGQNAPSQSFEVWNSGGGTLSYSVSDNATWLSVSPGSGTSTGEHDSITVTYSTTGLAAGTYNATITISASGANGSPQTVGVTLTVNPPPQTIISAYWLTPVYVTEGAVVTMRALVSGYNVGDQFAFEIREDDGVLGYDYVTTKYGNVYSSGGNYYVDATWTTVWQSDQSGDPEFYFVVSRGGASLSSSTVDASEMHVARGPVLSLNLSTLSPSVTQGQNASSQSFDVWNSGGGTLSYSISDNATWLSVSPSSGTSTGEHDSITVNYGTTGLSAGTYNATITISASGASGAPQTISVTLTVNPPPQSIVSAYWLTPVYVTEGAVVTMRAQVSGYNVGDQFAFEIREDDGILGYDYVTTKYGNVYSSGGNYYVDATWTTVWQSDQSGDPEFYFVVSRGGASLASSTVDANEMHVARGPVLSLNLSSLSPSVMQGQNAASQSFDVWNSGGGTLSYSISDDALWLSVSPSAGTSTGEHDSIGVNYSTTGLSAGTYYATITISASGANGSPQTISVTLIVNPRVSRISGTVSPPWWIGGAPTPVFIQRYPAGTTALIDPNLRTWIIIHGRGDSSTADWVSGLTGLAAAITYNYPNDQILLLDWTSAARPATYIDFTEEDWIKPVAAWAAGKLVDYGFNGSTLNLIGHSWGGSMAAEIAELIPYPGQTVNKVNSIVALDPAGNPPDVLAIGGVFNPEDLTADNGTREIDFARNSRFSWAFHSSIDGSPITPITAHESFIVYTGLSLVAALPGELSAHNAMHDIFTYMLWNTNGGVSSRFQLSRLLARLPGPWMPDLFTTRFDQGWPYIEKPTIGYEGIIYTVTGGQSPAALLYTNSSMQPILEYETTDTIAPTVTMNQEAGQSDPTGNSPINFAVVFSEAVTGFGSSDVTLGGTAGATSKSVTGSGTTYNVAVSGMTQSGTVTATIPAGAAQDGAGNPSLASTFSDNSVTYNAPALAQTITFNQPDNKTHGDAPFTLTASASSGLLVSFAVISGPATVSGSMLTLTGAGTVTVRASQSGGTGWLPAPPVDRTFTVAKAPLTVTANNASRTYGGANPSFSAAITGFVNGETAAVVSGTASFSTPATASSPVGSYVIVPAVGTLSAANYAFGNLANGTLAVTPATLTVTANNRSKTYGQVVSFGATEFTTSGLVGSDTVTGVALNSAGAGSTATVAGSPYSIAASGATGAGLGNYTISYQPGTLTVGPAALTVTANNRSKTYGQAVTFAGTEFTPSGLQNSETVGLVTLSSSGAAAAAGVGGSPYGIVPSAATGGTFNSANYTITYQNGTLAVSPAALTVTANNRSKTYGQTVTFAGTEFTTSGLANSETVGSVTLTSSGAAAAAAVGSYNIAPSAATGGTFNPANYTIRYQNGTLAVSPPAVTPSQLTGMTLSNGEFRFVLNGSVGSTYVIQVSSNLVNWLPFSTNTIPASGWLLITEPIMTNQPRRFYRAVGGNTIVAPSGMALIPGGSFTMGDTFSEGNSDEVPLHSVYVSAFYMDQYEVTKALWDDVYNWAITHGYSFDNGGSGKAATHPVQTVSWYDCVKWCNARSEKENKTPAYYTDAGLSVPYRTGQVAPYVNWSSGYRLPTEAEWEKAARGGAGGQRFPWADSDTISWSRANYYAYPLSAGGYAYDVNPTAGYNPNFQSGGSPYTSPVGNFAANGYGLYDMAGNVWEWCWDWYSSIYYSSSPGTDPRGSAPGSNRVFRGGSWGNYAFYCRTAIRNCNNPAGNGNLVGFRSVLPPGQ